MLRVAPVADGDGSLKAFEHCGLVSAERQRAPRSPRDCSIKNHEEPSTRSEPFLRLPLLTGSLFGRRRGTHDAYAPCRRAARTSEMNASSKDMRAS